LQRRTLKNFIDVLILNSLKKEGAKSGYDIIGLVHEKFGVLMSSGTIYAKLYSMERDGLIKAEWNSRKRVYRLTERGEKTINFFLNSKQTNLQLMKEILG